MLHSLQQTHSLEQIKDESNRLLGINTEVAKAIIGQQQTLTFIVIALLCDAHILLEGVPGVAKTTMIKAIAKVLDLHYSRIQFTPDLLPADLIGTLIYNPKTQEFETKKGPIFANLILADEINRAPAKVQAALLEAMEEKQVTIGSNTFVLDKPFLVFATQNPIEQEGTYRLPEAQLDRFMFKLQVTYPTTDQEKIILTKKADLSSLSYVVSQEDLASAKQTVEKTYVDEKIINYIVDIVCATRDPKKYGLHALQPYIRYGVSPRATIALHKAARAYAFLKQRHFVTPDDVKAVCYPILRHRLLLTYEAEAEEISTEQIIAKVLQAVVSP